MCVDHLDDSRPHGAADVRALAEESVRLAEEVLCGVECTVTVLRRRLDRLGPDDPAAAAGRLTLLALAERIARLHATRTRALRRLARLDARRNRPDRGHHPQAIRVIRGEHPRPARTPPTAAPPAPAPAPPSAVRCNAWASG
jgi:hypothetical protein